MVSHISLRNFRNHTDLSINITAQTVLIVGPNATGKTNILEALYFNFLTKSFRAKDILLVQENKSFFTIDITHLENTIHSRVVLDGPHKKKQFKINNQIKKHSDILGSYPLTLFEPSDLNLFTDLPAARRKYLDKILSQVDMQYLKYLLLYKKILTQKNSLLKKAKTEHIADLQERLFIYNVQIAKPMAYIDVQRAKLVVEITKLAEKYYYTLSRSKKDISFQYIPTQVDEEKLLSLLEKNLPNDLRAGFSTIGAHREDFEVQFGGSNIINTASRGELRSLVLAVKLAELDYIENILKLRPTLLLDDVFSELDTNRQTLLINALEKQQTFITATHHIDSLPSNAQTVNTK